jgi:hypothetical protein
MIPIDQGEGGGWQRSELADVKAKAVASEAFVDGKAATKHLARAVHDLYFKPKLGAMQATDELEPVECIPISLQGTRSHSAVQSDGKAGRVSGGSVLAVVLTHGVSVRPPLQLLNELLPRTEVAHLSVTALFQNDTAGDASPLRQSKRGSSRQSHAKV